LAPSIGRPISDIIGKQGEEAFHQCLSDILTYQKTKKNSNSPGPLYIGMGILPVNTD
jgi:hypothetical protein